MKFFGSVARLHPKEVLSSNNVFVSIVLGNLESPESVTLHSLAIQTVGFIGDTVEGKMALEKLGRYMDNDLTLMTGFRLFQTERVCRRQFQI